MDNNSIEILHQKISDVLNYTKFLSDHYSLIQENPENATLLYATAFMECHAILEECNIFLDSQTELDQEVDDSEIL